ncbi:MAG: dihydrolipoyl dehydrogenase [Oxalobacter sp.]|nr:MAG: dihydrolipoyl dehydrogenase [Oxalobacter sp.]
MKIDRTVDVAIIGAGTAGLYALREVRRARKSFVLIDHGPLGTTCARVGCMPSKVALHEGHMWSSRFDLSHIGVRGIDAMTIDTQQAWAAMRVKRDGFAGHTAERAIHAAGDALIEGRARFLEPTVLEVDSPKGRIIIKANAVVIATGSKPVMPRWLDAVRDRVVTTDELFEMPDLPQSMGIIGLGAIGVEMGLALSRLGVEVIGAGIGQSIAAISDPAINERAIARFGKEMTMWLGAPVSVEKTSDGVLMRSGEKQEKVERLLISIGRTPNVASLNLVSAGFPLDANGSPIFDKATMQIGDLPVFVAGDANGDRLLMHEAADEGVIAGVNAARGESLRFQRKIPFGIVFSDPDVANIGARFDELNSEDIVVGSVEGEANARSRVIDETESLIRIYADAKSGRLLGASMIVPRGEHIAHLLAWSIQRGETAESLMQMPFYHPVVEEMLPLALQDIVRKVPRAGGVPAGFILE